MEELEQLLKSLPGYDLVTEGMKHKALQGARIPDADGNMPGDRKYVPTYDAYFAAYGLVGFMQAQPAVTTASSEGTSVTTTGYNWDGLRQWLRANSAICQSTDADVFTVIPIPNTHPVTRTNMHGGGPYDDHDTDVN